MTGNEPPPLDDKLASVLALYDEALALGAGPVAAGRPGAPPESRGRLERVFDCLHRLNDLRPAQRTASFPGDPSAEVGTGPGVPTTFGRFRILRELGGGAFGIVYLAYDPSLSREVALKVPRNRGLLAPELRERFRREAKLAAGLSHPYLVPVYEAGEVDGSDYIASAYCPGGTLAGWLKDRTELVPARTAAELAATLAEALEYAHRHQVLHRDLKPSNVVLEPAAAGGGGDGLGFTPRITDFGLAKGLLSEADAGDSQSGAILGSPAYMAPEQAAGRPKSVGPAADVYGLGAILYELLTGRPPFQAESVLETLEQVRRQEPVPPRRLRPRVPRDLETVCLTCLEKDPRKRYPSAAALSEDLRRFLRGEPTHARPVRAWARGVKWARRRPAVAALLAGVLLTAAAGFAGVTWQWRRAEAASAAEARNARELRTQLYYRNLAGADAGLDAGLVKPADRLLDACPDELRGWEWRYLKRRRYQGKLPSLSHGTAAFAVALRPTAPHVASAGMDGVIRFWDWQTGGRVGEVDTRDSQIRGLAYSPDGQRLVSGGWTGRVTVWSAAPGGKWERHWTRDHGAPVGGVAMGPDGRSVATAGGRDVKLWAADTGETIRVLAGHTDTVFGAAFGGDGRRLASASADGTVKVWDVETGAVVRTFHHGHTSAGASVAVSPDGSRVAAASGELLLGEDHAVQVWDALTGRTVHTLRGHGEVVWGLAFSPDGSRLASASRDSTVKVWDMATGQEALTLRDHTDPVRSVAFGLSPGHPLASASANGSVQVWDARPVDDDIDRGARVLAGHKGRVARVVFGPGGRLASAGVDGKVVVWDARTGDQVYTLDGHSGAVDGLAAHPTLPHLASAGRDKRIRVWDWNTGRPVRPPVELDAGLLSIALSPDGRLLAANGGGAGAIRVWDLVGGTEFNFPHGHEWFMSDLAFGPDGRHLASASYDRTVRVFELSGRTVRTLAHGGRVTGVAFGPDGRHVASSCADGHVRVWDAVAGPPEPVVTSEKQPGPVLGVAFSPDGSRVGWAGGDATVRVWDWRVQREVAVFRGHGDRVTAVAFDPDGGQIASGSGDGTVRLWDLPRADAEPADGRKAGR